MKTDVSTSAAAATVWGRIFLPIRSRPLTYVVMGAVILGIDILTGPYILFPVSFVIPVGLAAWYCSYRFALMLAILLPVCRFPISVVLEQTIPWPYAIVNVLIRIAVFWFIAYLVARTSRQTRALEHEVKLLEGILPICSHCKKIRNERNEWLQMESYISAHSEASFSHGICPECLRQHYGRYIPGSQEQ